MTAKHPDFADIQRRLRRINPNWYPTRVAIDDIYGPTMAAGLDKALDMLERAHDLPPYEQPAVVAPAATKLSASWNWLLEPPIAPLMVRIALDMIGLVEWRGSANNPTIIAWADEVAAESPNAYSRWAADWYNKDSIPWCGLFMAVVAVRSAQGRSVRMPPEKYLSALEWAKFGEPVEKSKAAVGDVMVMSRNGGGHVCLNVGMEVGHKRFFGLGGNQSDAVNILPFDMRRVTAVRRPPYKTQPAGARQVTLGRGGRSSTNEA